MSKVAPSKLTLEDFPKQRDWIGPLFTMLNQFFGEVARAFSNQLTIEDNLYQEIKELKFTAGSADFPISFRTKFGVVPKALLVGYLFDSTVGTYSPTAPWVVWGFADGSVKISEITGLTNGNVYSIRLLLIYG